MTKKKMILAAAVLLSAGAASAQTAVVTAGGETGTVSFTVGQPFYETTTSDNGSLTAGVQQTFEIKTVEVGVAELAAAVELEAYPNPVTDRLTLRADAPDAALRYTLTDNNGRTLATDIIVDSQTEIDMSRNVQGIYFLRVDDGKTLVKTFKVVKNN